MHRVERFIYKNHFQPTPGTHNTAHEQILTQTDVWFYLHIAKRTYVLYIYILIIYTIIASYNTRTYVLLHMILLYILSNINIMYMLSNFIIYMIALFV